MKTLYKRKFFCLLLSIFLLAALSVSALAAEPGSAFLVGSDVRANANVEGILFAAGYRVEQTSTSEYALLAGETVRFDGTAVNDIFAAGYDVTINGEVARDVYAAGNSVRVAGMVGRKLYVSGSRVQISGQIGGDVYINAERIEITPSAVIGGTLRYNSSAAISASQELYDRAEVYEDESEPQPTAAQKFGSKALDRVLGFAGVVALAFVLLWLTPLWGCLDKKYSGAPFAKFAKAFGIGFAVLVGLPVAFIILLITRVGLRLAFVLLMVYIAALLASPVILGFFLGKLFWRDLCKRKACFAVELPIGIAIWAIFECIPVLSFVVNFVCAPLGLGVVTLLLGRGGKKPCAQQVEPLPLPETPAPDASVKDAEQPEA